MDELQRKGSLPTRLVRIQELDDQRQEDLALGHEESWKIIEN